MPTLQLWGIPVAIVGNSVCNSVLFNYATTINLLILDEWMLVSLRESEARDLLEITHSRHKKASTIFCSQFAPAGLNIPAEIRQCDRAKPTP
jgi:DNA replication protein DnaC